MNYFKNLSILTILFFVAPSHTKGIKTARPISAYTREQQQQKQPVTSTKSFNDWLNEMRSMRKDQVLNSSETAFTEYFKQFITSMMSSNLPPEEKTWLLSVPVLKNMTFTGDKKTDENKMNQIISSLPQQISQSTQPQQTQTLQPSENLTTKSFLDLVTYIKNTNNTRFIWDDTKNQLNASFIVDLAKNSNIDDFQLKMLLKMARDYHAQFSSDAEDNIILLQSIEKQIKKAEDIKQGKLNI